MADAATHMHARGIMHGDFYAHNIMIDKEANNILGDFGGASFFEPKEVEIRNGLERLEVRAFGCLMEEMLMLSREEKNDKRKKLFTLQEACLQKETAKRPLFEEIYTILFSI
jgi:serine/threonine protein kinase